MSDRPDQKLTTSVIANFKQVTKNGELNGTGEQKKEFGRL